MKYFPSLILFSFLVSCGPPQNIEIPLKYDDLVKNYGNNAIACHSPQSQNDKIFCQYTTRFAHHTLTFTQLQKLEGVNYKLQFKVRFDEIDNQACINYSSINDEKIKIYKSNNNFAEVRDDDILLDGEGRKKIANELMAKLSKMPQSCGQYILFTSNEVNMMYKVKYIEINDGKENKEKISPKIISFFSNGTKLEFSPIL